MSPVPRASAAAASNPESKRGPGKGKRRDSECVKGLSLTALMAAGIYKMNALILHTSAAAVDRWRFEVRRGVKHGEADQQR